MVMIEVTQADYAFAEDVRKAFSEHHAAHLVAQFRIAALGEEG